MKKAPFLLLVLALIFALPASAQDGPTVITLWRHTSDTQLELDESFRQIEAFNAAQGDWEIVFEQLPQQSYTDSVTAASLSGNLPCILDLDGPTVPNFAWAGHIQPIGDYLSEDLMADLLPSALGTYQGEIFSVGQYDAAVAIFGRRSVLEDAGIRIATIDEPWSLEEFNGALEILGEDFDYAIDMFTAYSGEWWPYAFSPILQSFGGDLIDRSTYLSAEGVLNGEEAVAWGEWFQNLFQSGLSDPGASDDQAFQQGRAALAYIGNWFYPALFEVYGEDLVIMPPPAYGETPVVGGASWQWGISSNCENPDGAWAYIEFLLGAENVAAMSNATGLIPATASGAALTETYGPDGPLSIFVDISSNFSVMRPETPAYPVIANTFESAAREIALGANVQDTLDDAVDAIDQNIADNNGYGF